MHEILSLKQFWNSLSLILCVFMRLSLFADLNQIDQSPIHIIQNSNSKPSMINSIDFHPSKNLFCATFTHNNQIVFYQLNEAGDLSIFQILENPSAELVCPQHALFSKDGNSLLVLNWVNQTFNVFRVDSSGFFESKPMAVIPYSPDLDSPRYKPHGMAFSPDGNYLAVAYGASALEPRAVALYEVKIDSSSCNIKLLSLIHDEEINLGIPKGVVFSPDGSCLIITLAHTNSLAIYTIDWTTGSIASVPKQILNGPTTQLSRPEDIKFTVDGNYCAVSNSTADTITFYEFDKKNNYFSRDVPSYIFENPKAQLRFPHGLAFSSDGNYFSVTHFGKIKFDENGRLSSWAEKEKEKITVYKIQAP